MIPSFHNENTKMSCSNINSKIDLLDSPKQIKKKINKAFCEEGNIKCGLFEFIKLVLFPILELKNEIFIIPRHEKYGGKIIYKSFEDLSKEFINKKIHPVDIKLGVSSWLIKLLEPLRNLFNTPEMKELIKKSY